VRREDKMKAQTDVQPLTEAMKAIPVLTGRHRGEDSKLNGASHSGSEPNNLFLNVPANGTRSFADVSAVSGFDDVADGRVLVRWDPNRDGRNDFAVVNANSPWLQLFENRVPKSGRFLAVRLVGGAESNERGSNRDGIGARIRLTAGEQRLIRERRAGDGFAGQSSSTMLIGLGDALVAREVEVRWPSGRTTRVAELPSGKLVTLFEHGEPEVRDYVAQPTPNASLLGEAAPALDVDLGLADGARLRVVIGTATWCEACTEALDEVKLLRDRFTPAQLALYGAPIDEDESDATLTDYQRRHAPAYRLLKGLGADRRRALRQRLVALVGQEVVPTTVVLDRRGRVLWLDARVPTESTIARLLSRHGTQ
jgi:ASPIC and UnbV